MYQSLGFVDNYEVKFEVTRVEELQHCPTYRINRCLTLGLLSPRPASSLELSTAEKGRRPANVHDMLKARQSVNKLLHNIIVACGAELTMCF